MSWRYIVFLLLTVSYFAHGQNTDVTVDEGIEKLKGMKKLKKYTDLKQVLKERPLINGGLNLTSRFNDVYSVSGASSLQPFIYTVGGNLNVKMFDFSVPFNSAEVVELLPIIVVFEPKPIADVPITI